MRPKFQSLWKIEYVQRFGASKDWQQYTNHVLGSRDAVDVSDKFLKEAEKEDIGTDKCVRACILSITKVADVDYVV